MYVRSIPADPYVRVCVEETDRTDWGHVSQHVTDPPDSQKNYLVVDSKTENATIEGAFENFTRERKDIAIVLINQHVRAAATGAWMEDEEA